MKKAIFASLAVIALSASAALAVPGINLGWTSCGTTSTTQDRVFTCNDNAATNNLVGSFRLAGAMTNFVAINANVEILFGGGSVPDWWQFASGTCREGSLGVISVGTITSCTNPYAGTIGQGGGFVYVEATPPAADRKLMNLDWARAEGTNLLADTRYTAFVAQINTALSWDEGDPANPVCAGCATPACLVLRFVDVYPSDSPNILLTDVEVRQFATWQGGSVGGAGCPLEVPVKNATWGQIKALYR